VSSELSRRAFLVGVAGAAVGVAAAGAWRLLDTSGPGVLGDFFGDDEAARSVGEAYLTTHPEEAGKETLLGLLDFSPTTAAVSHQRLRAAVRADYERSNLVLVEGWYLSRTEARICALSTYG
jgi:hypothetical protein